MTTTDVLIVGAGPTGLALATTLMRQGIEPLVVDRLATGSNASRAAVLHAHTLDVLEPLGVSSRLADAGLKLARFSIRDRDRRLLALRFDELPSAHPYLLMLPQDRTEQILNEALAGARGRVRWGCNVEALSHGPDDVEARLVSGAGVETVRARYVVGADGMQSIVRRTASIGFTGASYEDSFVLADVSMDWPLGRQEVMLFFSPAGLLVVAPLPGGRYRLVATLDQAPEKPGVADVQALLDERGPAHAPGTVAEVHWSSRFRIHHRVADRYRSGRFLLVGDAAHVHSPAGGQGMNTGLVDACVLGRMLGEVLAGGQDERYLDRYEALRKPAAEEVLRLAGRLTSMAVMKSAPRRALRNLVLRAMSFVPAARRRLEMNLSGLSRRSAAQMPSG